MAVSDEGVANLGATGLAGITTDILGDTWGKIFLVDVAVAIFVCCLAIHAMSVRIMFAMGRDNSLPFGKQLASVSGTRRVPIVPALTTGAIALIILASNWANPRAFTIIISMGIILMYIAYIMLTTQLLRRRNEGWPGNLPDAQDGLFSLGPWAKLTNVVAILYGARHDHQPGVAAGGVLRPALVPEIRADHDHDRALRARARHLLRRAEGQGRGARGAPGQVPRRSPATDPRTDGARQPGCRAPFASYGILRPVTDSAYSDMVRRDVRSFAIAGFLLVASLAALVLWKLEVVGRDGRLATIALGLAAFLVSILRWAEGDRRIRERLFVIGPGVAAAVPLGIGIGGPIGLGLSFALALLATYAFAASRAGS